MQKDLPEESLQRLEQFGIDVTPEQLGRLSQREVDDIRDGNGRTLLMIAVVRQETELLRVVLKAGANPNLGNDTLGYPLLEASASGHTAIVKLLLRYHADPKIRNGNGESPTHYAAQSSGGEIIVRGVATKMLALLLKAGAPPDEPSSFSETPLLIVIQSGDYEAAKVLLRYGANPFNSECIPTPYDYALQNALTDFLELFLRYGNRLH